MIVNKVQEKPLVFLCMPRYSATVDARAHRSFLTATKGGCQVSFGTEGIGGSPIESQTSVLTQAFNQPWVMALNLKAAGHPVTHFAMLHADVEAEFGWLDKLVAEQRRTGADVVSTVIPFKLPTGITSTALGEADWGLDSVSGDEKPRRFTMREVQGLPKTFSAADIDPAKILLINTGCWVCRFDEPWVEEICFRFLNKNYIGADGKHHTACRTEDFDFSVQAHHLNLDVRATTAVAVRHHGECAYPNDIAWGQWETDEEYKATQRAALLAH